MTTASFSHEATEYADMIEASIVLIDGTRLARLMVEFGLGVSVAETYLVKQIDADFFPEE